MKRRSVLQAVAAVAASPSLGTVASGAESGTVYTRLGVKPVINGMGTVTVLGGSRMSPEVVRAMEEASRPFVLVPDLQWTRRAARCSARNGPSRQRPARRIESQESNQGACHDDASKSSGGG